MLNDDNHESRALVEYCYRTTSTMVNPIIEWEDEDVWEYLGYYGCCSNPLYQCGETRVGCIGCPMGGYKGMKRDFARRPEYRQLYVNAFDRMIIHRKERGIHDPNGTWQTGEDVMRWWLGDDPRQITLDDIEEAVGIEEVAKWY